MARTICDNYRRDRRGFGWRFRGRGLRGLCQTKCGESRRLADLSDSTEGDQIEPWDGAAPRLSRVAYAILPSQVFPRSPPRILPLHQFSVVELHHPREG